MKSYDDVVKLSQAISDKADEKRAAIAALTETFDQELSNLHQQIADARAEVGAKMAGKKGYIVGQRFFDKTSATVLQIVSFEAYDPHDFSCHMALVRRDGTLGEVRTISRYMVETHMEPASCQPRLPAAATVSKFIGEATTRQAFRKIKDKPFYKRPAWFSVTAVRSRYLSPTQTAQEVVVDFGAPVATTQELNNLITALAAKGIVATIENRHGDDILVVGPQ